MSLKNCTTVKYECPECGLIEEELYTPKELRRPVIHICWFCLLKDKHIEMRITDED